MLKAHAQHRHTQRIPEQSEINVHVTCDQLPQYVVQQEGRVSSNPQALVALHAQHILRQLGIAEYYTCDQLWQYVVWQQGYVCTYPQALIALHAQHIPWQLGIADYTCDQLWQYVVWQQGCGSIIHGLHLVCSCDVNMRHTKAG